MGLDKAGYEHVVVVVKGTFTLPQPGETPKLADEQVPLVDADLFTGEPGRSATLVECDYALEKPRCDVLLNGAAYAPGGRPVERIAVGLQVGAWRKSFVGSGQPGMAPRRRRLLRRASRSRSIACRSPMTMRSAARMHGCAIRRSMRSYLPNPVGRGWHHHIYPELVLGAPVSNTEETRDPVRDPGGKYRPMAFGPIGRGWPSRIRYAGTYDQNWIDNVFPFLPADFDSRLFPVRTGGSADHRIRVVGSRCADQSDAGWTARICPAVGRNADCVLSSSRRSGGDEGHARHDAVRAGAERFSMVWRASLQAATRYIRNLAGYSWDRCRAHGGDALETGKSYRSMDTIVRESAAEREDA